AAEAAGRQGEALAASNIGELRALMVDRHGEALERVLTKCSLPVDGVAASPHPALGDDAVVDVPPPSAAGPASTTHQRVPPRAEPIHSLLPARPRAPRYRLGALTAEPAEPMSRVRTLRPAIPRASLSC